MKYISSILFRLFMLTLSHEEREMMCIVLEYAEKYNNMTGLAGEDPT